MKPKDDGPSYSPLLHLLQGDGSTHISLDRNQHEQIVEKTRGDSQRDIDAGKALAPQQDASYALFGLRDWASTSKMVRGGCSSQ
jgi:hypothetical protein